MIEWDGYGEVMNLKDEATAKDGTSMVPRATN